MPRDAFQEHQRTSEALSIRDKLAEIRSACLVVKTKAAELSSLQQKWAAGVPSGDYDQVDVDRLAARVTKIAALAAAVNVYLA